MELNTQIIDDIIKSNKITFLECTKEDCKDEFYLNKINDLIIYFKNIDKKQEDLNKFESDIDQRLAQIDIYAYRKSWNKLSTIQKEIKLKEFMKSYFINNNENTENIKNKILDDFKNNKLNSGKVINYEAFATNIIGINKLNYNTDNNKYSYE